MLWLLCAIALGCKCSESFSFILQNCSNCLSASSTGFHIESQPYEHPKLLAILQLLNSTLPMICRICRSYLELSANTSAKAFLNPRSGALKGTCSSCRTLTYGSWKLTGSDRMSIAPSLSQFRALSVSQPYVRGLNHHPSPSITLTVSYQLD